MQTIYSPAGNLLDVHTLKGIKLLDGELLAPVRNLQMDVISNPQTSGRKK